MARSEDVRTPECRFAFTRGLFELQTGESGREYYGCTLLFPKTADISELKALAVKAAVAEWGEKAIQQIKDGVIKSPFLDGDGPQGISKKSGERNPGYAGNTFIRVTSGKEFKPKIVDRRMNPVVDVSGIPSGWYGKAVVNAFTWFNEKNGKGITFGISTIQVQREGESLGGGGADPSQFFEKLEDEKPTEQAAAKGAQGLFD